MDLASIVEKIEADKLSSSGTFRLCYDGKNNGGTKKFRTNIIFLLVLGIIKIMSNKSRKKFSRKKYSFKVAKKDYFDEEFRKIV